MSWLLPAVLLALSPLIWRLASTSPIALVPILLIAVWLIAVASLQGARVTVWAIVAGVSLGAGMYVSPASAVMMPILAAITLGCAAQARVVSTRDLGIFAAAFALVAAPFAIGLILHPEEYRRLVLSHHLYDANRFNIRQGVREITSWVGMTARSEVYWDYLNPAFLFITGRVLAWPLALFLPIGVYRTVIGDSKLIDRVSLLGLLASPIAGALTAEPPVPERALWIIPFAAMVASQGIMWLIGWWRSSGATATDAAAASPPASR
jgi:hypothetical protein